MYIDNNQRKLSAVAETNDDGVFYNALLELVSFQIGKSGSEWTAIFSSFSKTW